MSRVLAQRRCGSIGANSAQRRSPPVADRPLGSTPGGGWPTSPPREGKGGAGCVRRSSLVEPQVRREAVPSAFAAEARLLVAAEGRRRVEAVVRVRPYDPRAQALDHP